MYIKKLLVLTIWFCVHIFCLGQIAKAETAQGTVSAEIRTGLHVFETLSQRDNSYIITLGHPDNIRSKTGRGNTIKASFAVRGRANESIAISLANGNLTGTDVDIEFSNFIHRTNALQQFDENGLLLLSVIAEIQSNNTQLDRLNQGAYQVTINY